MPDLLLFNEWPFWAQFLLRGLLMFALLATSTVVLTRAGRSPYWAIVMIVPYAAIIGIWVFAFVHWPKVDQKEISATNGK